jgi:hypothetical protein
MAWTAPRDWTAISGGIVTAASLNTDLRDNLGVLSTHAHTGAAGMGATTMSGLTLTALVNLTFADEGAPTSAGELQRHGNDLKFYGASAVNLTASDASAGTASLRSLGTTSVKAAAGNHTHTLSQEHYATSGYQTASHTGENVEVTICTITRAMADSKNALVLSAFGLAGGAAATAANVFRIRTAAAILDTETVTTNNAKIELHAFVVPASTSSTDYLVTTQVDRSGYHTTQSATLFLTEVTYTP